MANNRVLIQKDTPVANYIDISEKLDLLVSKLAISEKSDQDWKRNYSTWDELNTACIDLGANFSTDGNVQIDPTLNNFKLELVNMKLTFLSGAIDAFFETSDNFEQDLLAALCRATTLETYENFLEWVDTEVFKFENLRELLDNSFKQAKTKMAEFPSSFY